MWRQFRHALAVRVAAQFDRRYQQLPPVAAWWSAPRHEACVYAALSDVCLPGGIVFDVGANVGVLTVPMSRWVGVRGHVCAFEASLRSLPQLQQSISHNGCSNVRIVHAAVCDSTGGSAAIAFGHHPPADRIVLNGSSTSNASTVRAPKLALDDFADYFDLWPSVIKMDIEGAEYAALQGCRKILSRQRPVLILECTPDDQNAVEFVRNADYTIIDLATLRPIHSVADYAPRYAVSNVLCFPQERPVAGYTPPIVQTPRTTLIASKWSSSERGMAILSEPLPPGRYSCELNFKPTKLAPSIRIGVRFHGCDLVVYEGAATWLESSYRHLIWELVETGPIQFFIEPCDGNSRLADAIQLRDSIVCHVESIHRSNVRHF